MSYPFPFSKREIYLIRHGKTEWSKAGKHTGLTDIELTEQGKEEAKSIGKALKEISFEKVFSSPLKRAHNTCIAAGYPDPIISDELLEWNYGNYEGKTSAEIAAIDPNWVLFKDGAPGGESLEQVQKRADQFLARIVPFSGNIAVFSSGHFIRCLTARALGLEVTFGRLFYVATSSITILGTEHNKPVLISSNILCHIIPK
jgi:broad specificity phosphatase PhoE